LAHKFPDTVEELDEAAQGFASLSTQGAMKGCVACLDVFYYRYKCLQAVRQAMSRQIFSGHYQTYRINVQAACGYKFRFVYAALVAPGGANDIAAS